MVQFMILDMEAAHHPERVNQPEIALLAAEVLASLLNRDSKCRSQFAQVGRALGGQIQSNPTRRV